MFLKTIIITICFTSLSIYSMEFYDKISESDCEWFRVKLQEYKKARKDKVRKDNEVARLQKATQHCNIPQSQLTARIGIVHRVAGFRANL